MNLFNFLFTFILPYSKADSISKCLKTSVESCLTCLSDYYEKNYLHDLKLSSTLRINLMETDCIKKISAENKRRVVILNKGCLMCENFDKNYSNLAEALEEETKMASQ